MQLLGWQDSGPEGCICVMPSIFKIGFTSYTEIDSMVSEGVCRTPPVCPLLLLPKSSSSCLGGDPWNYAPTDHPRVACRTSASQAEGKQVARSGLEATQEWPLTLLRLSLFYSAPLAWKYHRDYTDFIPF